MRKQSVLEAFSSKMPGILGAAAGVPGEPPVHIRGTEIFPAASLIKVPILVYLFKQYEQKKIDLGHVIPLRDSDKVDGSGILLELHESIPLTLADLAKLMIVVSDNTATNLLVDYLGMDKIQEMIRRLGLKQTVLARKMYVDPEAPPANFTTPLEMFQLFEMLVNEKLLSPSGTKMCMDILFAQQYNEKIPLRLPQGTKVAHKTGEIEGVRHDCGIIQTGKQNLIVCLLTKNLTNEIAADRLLADLSYELYRSMSPKPHA